MKVWVCLLKSLYGLKQAGWKWYNTSSHALADLGFQVNNANPGVFTSHVNIDITILHLCWQLPHTGSLPKLIADYKNKLNKQYSLTNLGPVHWLLSIKITHDHQAHTILLLQMSYIDAILSCFSLNNAKPVATLITPGTVLTQQSWLAHRWHWIHSNEQDTYCKAIGSLMYAAVTTCPNITFTVSALLQFLKNPGTVHWEAVKHIFHLIGTKNLTLTYGNKCHELIGFTDTNQQFIARTSLCNIQLHISHWWSCSFLGLVQARVSHTIHCQDQIHGSHPHCKIMYLALKTYQALLIHTHHTLLQ